MVLARTLSALVASALVITPLALAAGRGPAETAEAFVQALSHADLPALLELLTDDATVFGPSPGTPERIEGKEQIASLFEPLFVRLRESREGPVYMNLVPRDLDTRVAGDTAVVTFHLGQVPSEPLDVEYSFSRRTLVLHRKGGRWQVVHLHASSVILPPGRTSDAPDETEHGSTGDGFE